MDSFPVNDSHPDYARRSLLIAARELSSRGLDHSAAWALDLVSCLPSSSSASSNPSSFFDSASQPYHGDDYPTSAPWAQGGGPDSSLSWQGYPPTSTPARPRSSLRGDSRTTPHHPSSGSTYPMQSTPFIGSQSSSQQTATGIMISAPSSGSLGPTESSPQRSEGRGGMLAVEGSPSQKGTGSADQSTSGRFPPPFKQPPSPLQNLSYSAEGEGIRRQAGSSNGAVDQLMEDSIDEDSGRTKSSRADGSAHVRFASEAEDSLSDADMGHQGMVTALDQEDSASYELAMSYFRTRQLDRCHWVLYKNLARCKTRGRRESERHTFLRIYSHMLILERDSAPDIFQLSAASSLPRAYIPLLKDLIDPSDPFLLFLKGLLLRKLHKRLESLDCFIRSLLLFPYNWTVWLELNGVLDSSSGELEDIVPLLPKSFMTLFFLESHDRQSAASRDPEINARRVERLLDIFPENAGLWNSFGVGKYLQQDFDSAIEAFQRALEIDPYRTDGLADYSNALFLTERGPELTHLAHTCSSWGSESPEVCVVVGNHFYYQSDHPRAIEAFQRAIKLDPQCLAAWILLGHAFLEIKNAGAASEMYRRAIEMNPRDYRPWHGLGKVYELLEAYSFAVHYYLKAVGIGPFTGTVWISLASAYTKMVGRGREAIEAYKRHLSCESDSGGQLESIRKILALLEELTTEAKTSSSTSQKQLQDLIDETTAWHRRAVSILLSQGRQNNNSLDTSSRDASTSHRLEGDSILDPTSSQSNNIDLEMWGPSLLRLAKIEAGLPADYTLYGNTSLFIAQGQLEDEVKNVRDTPLAREYLTRILGIGSREEDRKDESQEEGSERLRLIKEEAWTLRAWLNRTDEV